MDRVRSKEVHRRAGIEGEFASGSDWTVLEIFGTWNEFMSIVCLEGCWWRK